MNECIFLSVRVVGMTVEAPNKNNYHIKDVGDTCEECAHLPNLPLKFLLITIIPLSHVIKFVLFLWACTKINAKSVQMPCWCTHHLTNKI